MNEILLATVKKGGIAPIPGKWVVTKNIIEVPLIDVIGDYQDGKIYSYGGTTGSNIYNNQMRCFDIKTGVTTILPSLGDVPDPRINPAGCIWNNKFWLTGGRINPGGLPSTVNHIYSYDLNTNTWKREGSLPMGLYGHTMFRYMFGGLGIAFGDTGAVYLSSDGVTYTKASKNAPSPVYYTQGHVSGYNLVVSGGFSGSWSNNKLLRYDFGSDVWTETIENAVPVASYPQTVVRGNKYYQAGGVRYSTGNAFSKVYSNIIGTTAMNEEVDMDIGKPLAYGLSVLADDKWFILYGNDTGQGSAVTGTNRDVLVFEF